MTNVSTTSMASAYNNDLFKKNTEFKYFDTQFSEKNVLELQQMFLTFGVHYIKTRNIQSGRKIISTILNSLKYYQNIGAVTHASKLDKNICDILLYIKMQGFHSGDIYIDLENFFTIHACFDFIWIECTSLMKASEITNIKNIFDMYHANERMPVIIMMYDKE